MDDDDRRALRAEGLDPDDPAVIAVIDLVRWELSMAAVTPALLRGRSDEVVDPTPLRSAPVQALAQRRPLSVQTIGGRRGQGNPNSLQ